MTLEPGTTLLHYRLAEKIGEGGMGVVWKAVDTTLDREVAIKVLPDAFAQDADRVARFEREAKLLAALTHPNVAAVHSVHEHEGLRFLAMEYVPGEDLAQRIGRGPIDSDEALRIAVQIAQALEAAHERGIVHRDLKPANVRLTPDGVAKVLDFGLARALANDPQSSDPSLSPTLTSAGTVAGVILGTAAYMSPEQARGHTSDARADVWAFGCLLYEMLTGERAFPGETISDTLAGILKSEPDLDALPADSPAAIRRLLRRCLTKDRARRLHHAADARLVLLDALEIPEDDAPGAEAPATSRAAWFPWVLAAGLAALAIWALASSPRPAADAEPTVLSAALPGGITFVDVQESSMALSRDGRRIAVILSGEGTTRLYVRDLGNAEWIPVEVSRGAGAPFFSPDGAWVGFFADGDLRKVSIEGGVPLTLCKSGDVTRGATWTDDDLIVFSPEYNSPLMQVSGDGGTPTPLTSIDEAANERTHRWPSAIPGTDLVLFTVGTQDSPEFYDNASIDVVHTGTGERTRVLEGASLAFHSASGHLVFARGGTLFAQPFDANRVETTGPPRPAVESVMGARRSGVVHAAVSTNGTLAYVPGGLSSSLRVLEWRYLDGRSERIDYEPAPLQYPDLSPDGRRLAVSLAGERDFDVWVYDIETLSRSRLTFDEGNIGATWSRDGRHIAFYSLVSDDGTAFRRPVDGRSEKSLVYHREGYLVSVTDWAPDGREVVLETVKGQGDIEIFELGGETTRTVLATPADERNARYSPDGRYLVYQSSESGRDQVYVRAVEGAGKWQVSRDGGVDPDWPASGNRIFFRSDRRLYQVPVDTSDGMRIGEPEAFSELTVRFGREINAYSAHPDGDRVVVVDTADPSKRPNEVRVVLNWFETLR